jgi:hypothetical protein
MKIPIGIDLGTTNCCMAWTEGGRVAVYRDEQGRSTIPSIVAEESNGNILVGWRAKTCNQPLNRHGFFKRSIGTDQKYRLQNGYVTACELSAYILKDLRERAEKALHAEVAAVITVPAHFESIHINETQRAAQMAGLETLYILREPIAAALAYYDESRTKQEAAQDETILVYDFGGGTFDATVCVRNGSHVIVGAQGRAYDGDKFLGGFDFDKALVRSATRMLDAQGFKIGIDSFEYREPAPESLRSPWLWELLTSAEACKKALSDEMEVQWTKDLLIKESGLEGTLNMWVTRQQFEEMIRPLINDTLRFCERALLNHASTAGEHAKRRSREEQLQAAVQKLDKVILVGGSSLVPCVKHMIRTHFEQIAGRELEIKSFRPYECVGIGAAIYAETFRASKSKEETSSLFNWPVMPRERVGDEVGLHPELLGRVIKQISPGSSIRYTVGEQSAAVEVGPDGSFRIPPFRLEPGDNSLELTLLDDSGQVCGRESHRIVREGMSFSEPGLARPIFMRLLDGSIDLIPVGTRSGMVTQSDPLFVSDRSGKIRAPLYEGHHPITTKEFAVEARVGTPVVFQTRYEQGKLDMEIKIGDLAPLRTEVNLERLELSDDRSKMWSKFMELENKIARQLEDLPKDEPHIETFKREQTTLIFDIQTEFENPDILDLARLDDRIRQLEVLSWKIQAFSQTARGLKYRLDEVRKKIREVGEDADLLQEIDDLEARLPEKDDLEIIVSLEAKLDDIWRRYIIRHPSPVDPSDVLYLEKQIRLKIERIYLWKGNDPKTEAILYVISNTFEKIVASDAEMALRVSRLWELEFHEINPIYQEIVIRRGQEGLLSRTPRSDSGRA